MAGSPSGVALAYYVLPAVATVLHAVLAYWILLHHRHRSGAKWFVIALATGGVGTFAFWLFMLAPPGPLKLFLFYPSALGALASYVAFAVFAGRYTGTDYHRHWLVRAMFVVTLGGFVGMMLVRPYVNLFFTNVHLVTDPVVYYSYDLKSGLLVIYLLNYLLGFYNAYKLIRYLLSTSARSAGQLVLLVCGALSIVLITAASEAGLFPATDLNHAPYATIPFILLTTFALFRFDFLNVQPVARNAVVENLRDPVLVLDDERRIVDYNAASTAIWPDLGSRVGESFEAACPALAEAVDPGDPDRERTAQVTLPTEDGERHFSVTVSSVARTNRDETEWLSILLRDVTALERSRWQLEKQNERLDQVASTISHDLRNPIQVADGYAEILERLLGPDGLDPDEAATAADHVGEIRSTHTRMEAIIADVLTIAREGKTVDETEPVSLAAVAREAWDNVDTGEARLSVTGDLTIPADHSKFLSILENCFRNAVDHGPPDVTVTVGPTTGGPTPAGENGPEGSTGFFVADDGPGIPAEHRDNVFEYGYTTSQEGTGLGLSIVRTMAESHGWTVELDADYEGGARFVFAEVGGKSVTEEQQTRIAS
ncbi:ATP-binding protein [Halorientalis halophila]|uniref:ATP-binding protein n=1 Tax=Halorientalis halophila TaxID=3108499 RepID=UPI0030096EF4